MQPQNRLINNMTLLSHLLELRRRALRAVVVVACLFFAFSFEANSLYHLLAQPLLSVLPSGTQMIATAVAAPFIVPLKLAFFVSIVVAFPYLIWQLWAFVAPALYQHERRLLWPLLFGSVLLFYTGFAFAYGVVLPLTFRFMVGSLPSGVTMATDIGCYLDFIMTLFLSFGVAFQLPLLQAMLCRLGVVSVSSFSEKRPHAIVLAFIAGMLLSPPDVLSQVLLALPLCLLYEAGILLARWWQPEKSMRIKKAAE